MDLLNPKVPLDLSVPDWKIYSRNSGLPPHFVAEGAAVQNSMISEGGNIYGRVDFSVLFSGVTVEPGAEVRDSILMPGARVMAGAKVQYAIIAENAVIGEGATVGSRPEETEQLDGWGVAVVASGVRIGRGCAVPPKGMVDSDMEDAR